MLECFVRPMAQEVWGAADVRLFDEAVDYAARASRATVSEFIAAPSAPDDQGRRWIDVAIEFFVPPCSLACFADELDRALIRRSLVYGAARRGGRAEAACVTPLSSSVFHQWRVAWKVTHRTQHAHRWSNDRAMLEQVLRYATTGWREVQ